MGSSSLSQVSVPRMVGGSFDRSQAVLARYPFHDSHKGASWKVPLRKGQFPADWHLDSCKCPPLHLRIPQYTYAAPDARASLNTVPIPQRPFRSSIPCDPIVVFPQSPSKVSMTSCVWGCKSKPSLTTNPFRPSPPKARFPGFAFSPSGLNFRGWAHTFTEQTPNERAQFGRRVHLEARNHVKHGTGIISPQHHRLSGSKPSGG